jgi:hypothetical protein
MISIPEELLDAVSDARARIHFRYPWWLRPLVHRGVVGITLGRRIYLAPAVATHSSAEIARLLRHELVHVQQVNRLGLPRFLWQYIREYVRHRRSGLSSAAAYESLSFEREARAAEDAV